jgi:hypothetical protein
MLGVLTYLATAIVQNRNSLQSLKKSSVYQQPNNRAGAERIIILLR